MASMCEQRANAGTMVVGKYLYAFGGFQTQHYGQVGVSSFERLDITNPAAKWEMQQFTPDSIDLGEIACFYLFDMTNYLKENATINDPTIIRNENGDIERAIMLIGGWSKHSFLTELSIFYPNLCKLTRWSNERENIRLQAPDMITKRPILYQDCLHVLGRHHIHIIDLKNKKTYF